MAAIPHTARDAAIVARTILGEALPNASAAEKAAIAAVIANRAMATDTSPAAAALAKVGKTYQFTAWSPKYGNDNVNITDGPEYEAALAIAEGILNGTIADSTFGATNYFNPSIVNPPWGDNLANPMTIGDHFFGRDESVWGEADPYAVLADVWGGLEAPPASDASYFGDLSGGGHQGLPFGLSPNAVATNQSPFATPNSVFTPSYAEQSQAAQPNTQFTQAQPNTQVSQAQPNNSFVQAQPNNAFAEAQAVPFSFAPAQYMGDDNAAPIAPAAPPTVAAPAAPAVPTSAAAPAAAVGKLGVTTAAQKAAAVAAINAQFSNAPPGVKSALTALAKGDKAAAAFAFVSELGDAASKSLGGYNKAITKALTDAMTDSKIGPVIFSNLDNNPALINAIPENHGLRAAIVDGLGQTKEAQSAIQSVGSKIGGWLSGLLGGGADSAPAAMAPSIQGISQGMSGLASAGKSTGTSSAPAGFAPSSNAGSIPSSLFGTYTGTSGLQSTLNGQAATAGKSYGSYSGPTGIPSISPTFSSYTGAIAPPQAQAIASPTAKVISSPTASAIASPYASAISSPFASAIASPTAQAIAPTQAKAIASPTVASFAPPTVQANPAYTAAQSQLSAAQQTLANIASGGTMTPAQQAAALYGAPKAQTPTITKAQQEETVAQLEADLANLSPTITVAGKPMAKSTKAAPMSVGGIPIAAGIGGNGLGLYGFANTAPGSNGQPGTTANGGRGYTVNNGITTYSTHGGLGTISFNQSTGAIVSRSGAAASGSGLGAMGFGLAPASTGVAQSAGNKGYGGFANYGGAPIGGF